MKSQELFHRSLKVAPGGVHSPVRAFKSVGGEPLFFKSTQGPFITTVEGQQLIDFCQSFGPNILGHRDPDVQNVVNEMVNTAWTMGACEPYSLELAEWLCERLPWVDKLRFVCSGTEAVMTALRLAKAYTGRNKILKFEGCYHGHVDSMLVKAGSGLADGVSASDSAGVSEAVSGETLFLPLDDEAAVKKLFEEQGSEIAAIILEPLPANYGLLQQRKEYIEEICSAARNAGALVIFDEVISGFRVGLEGMAGELGISPDLVTYGKIVGGGFPVGAYAGRKEIMDQAAPVGSVYQAGTLAANPIGMCAGLSTLKKVVEENVYEVLAKRTEDFASSLNPSFEESNIPLAVSHKASLFWIHRKVDGPIRKIQDFHKDHAKDFARFFNACIKQGVYLAPSAFEVGFVSYAHTSEVLEKSVESILAAAREVYA